MKAFFEGNFEYTEETIKEELSPIKENKREKDNKKSKKNIWNKRNEDLESVTLPIVDSYEQNTWRRNILFDKIKKS